MATIILTVIRNKLFRDPVKFLMIICCIILLPLAFMSIVVLAPKVSITDVTGILMLPHMNYIYIFLLVLLEKMLKSHWQENLLCFSAGLACVYVAVTLGMYTQIFQNCIEYEMKKSYALGQRIVGELEKLSQYSSGMKVVIGGRAEYGNYPRSYPEMYDVVKGTAVNYGFFWDTVDGNQICWNQFFRQYLCVEYSRASQDELISIFASTEYNQMPVFPHNGSVAVINDITVVKLSP